MLWVKKKMRWIIVFFVVAFLFISNWAQKTTNIFIAFATVAVIIFSGFFAFNMYAFVVNRRDTHAARETSDHTLRIFDDWLASQNQPPSAAEGTAPILYAPTDPNTTPGAIEVTRPPGWPMNDEHELVIDGTLMQADAYRPICFQTLIQTLRAETGNNDIIAFINIPGTNIQYVVVQGRDNAFYLDRDLFGQRNSAGTIFMDYRNRADFNNPSTILYGHHLRSGLKFSQLHLFRQQDFFFENRYIQIFTDSGLIEYEIFAVFVTHISFDYIQVNFRGNEFNQLINEIMRRRFYNADIPVTTNDQILVLSTCTSVHVDERLVVVGRRK